MTERRVTTKNELLAEIEQDWAALQALLARLTEAQMTTRKDSAGWTVKDHLAHLLAWERSVLFFLQGKPRHEGLGVEEFVYLSEEEDYINEAIWKQNRRQPLDQLLRDWRAIHDQLLDTLQPLTEADLLKPYRHYLPDEVGDGDGPPAFTVVYDNSAHHYAEHLGWIRSLINT